MRVTLEHRRRASAATTGAVGTAEGPFVLIEFDRTRPVVHLEHYRSSTTITDAGDVRDYRAASHGQWQAFVSALEADRFA